MVSTCSSMSCDSLSNVTKRGEPKSWRTKVHPALLEVLQLYRDSNKTLLKSSPADFKLNAEKLRAQISQAREELLKRYPELQPGSPSKHVTAASARFLSERDTVFGSLEWLCWRRTGRPLEALLAEEKAGNLKAHENARRVTDDFWRV